MGSATVGWPSLRSLFALAISAVRSAADVKVLVGLPVDCGGGCGAGWFANAAAAKRVKARPMIIVRMEPPSVFCRVPGCYPAAGRNRKSGLAPLARRIVRLSGSRLNGFGVRVGLSLPAAQPLGCAPGLIRRMWHRKECLCRQNRLGNANSVATAASGPFNLLGLRNRDSRGSLGLLGRGLLRVA